MCIINSGTLRNDSIIPSGNITLGDLKKIISFPDSIVLLSIDGNYFILIKITSINFFINVNFLLGKTLHKVLENGVSMYPRLEG